MSNEPKIETELTFDQSLSQKRTIGITSLDTTQLVQTIDSHKDKLSQTLTRLNNIKISAEKSLELPILNNNDTELPLTLEELKTKHSSISSKLHEIMDRISQFSDQDLMDLESLTKEILELEIKFEQTKLQIDNKIEKVIENLKSVLQDPKLPKSIKDIVTSYLRPENLNIERTRGLFENLQNIISYLNAVLPNKANFLQRNFTDTPVRIRYATILNDIFGNFSNLYSLKNEFNEIKFVYPGRTYGQLTNSIKTNILVIIEELKPKLARNVRNFLTTTLKLDEFNWKETFAPEVEAIVSDMVRYERESLKKLYNEDELPIVLQALHINDPDSNHNEFYSHWVSYLLSKAHNKLIDLKYFNIISLLEEYEELAKRNNFPLRIQVPSKIEYSYENNLISQSTLDILNNSPLAPYFQDELEITRNRVRAVRERIRKDKFKLNYQNLPDKIGITELNQYIYSFKKDPKPNFELIPDFLNMLFDICGSYWDNHEKDNGFIWKEIVGNIIYVLNQWVKSIYKSNNANEIQNLEEIFAGYPKIYLQFFKLLSSTEYIEQFGLPESISSYLPEIFRYKLSLMHLEKTDNVKNYDIFFDFKITGISLDPSNPGMRLVDNPFKSETNLMALMFFNELERKPINRASIKRVYEALKTKVMFSSKGSALNIVNILNNNKDNKQILIKIAKNLYDADEEKIGEILQQFEEVSKIAPSDYMVEFYINFLLEGIEEFTSIDQFIGVVSAVKPIMLDIALAKKDLEEIEDKVSEDLLKNGLRDYGYTSSFTILNKLKDLRNVGKLDPEKERLYDQLEGLLKLKDEKQLLLRNKTNRLDRFNQFFYDKVITKSVSSLPNGISSFARSELGQLIFIEDNEAFAEMFKRVDGLLGKILAFPIDEYPPFLITPELQKQILSVTNPEDIANLPENSWLLLISILFISDTDSYVLIQKINHPIYNHVKELFKSEKVKSWVLSKFNEIWLKNLHKVGEGIEDSIIFQVNRTIDFANGAADLKYIDEMCIFYKNMHKRFNTTFKVDELDIYATSPVTIKDIYSRLAQIEERFNKYQIDNETKFVFYSVSSEIIKYSPSLYSEFLQIILSLDGVKNFKIFITDTYPIILAKLTLLNISKVISPRKLAEIRQELRIVNGNINKELLLKEVSDLFLEVFGITKLPENFDQESIRIIRDMSIYLANIAERNNNESDIDNKVIIATYLAIIINGKWDEFRRGEIKEMSDYFRPQEAIKVNEFLKLRLEKPVLTFDNLGLSELDATQRAEFMRILVGEERILTIENIQTIDDKLLSLSSNIKEFTDPDIYQGVFEKGLFDLYSRYPSEEINKVLALMFKDKDFSASEIQILIQDEISSLLEKKVSEITVEDIKKIQDEKVYGLIQKVIKTLNDSNLEVKVQSFKDLLKPSNDVIAIFNRLGEPFKNDSGAVALSEDLSYLENLVVKHLSDLEPSEVTILQKYINTIKSSMQELESIYFSLEKLINSAANGMSKSQNLRLQDRVKSVMESIHSTNKQETLQVQMTGNFVTIIENIRACLGCLTKEINNDTNLTFGDCNRFLLLTSPDKAKKSYADEILYFIPSKDANGNIEVSFVFDNVYGSRSSNILINHIQVVLKKYRLLKQKFPNAKISLFVTQAAYLSVGITPEILMNKLMELDNENLSMESTTRNIAIPKSVSGDAYAEFQSEPRSLSEHELNGVLIK